MLVMEIPEKGQKCEGDNILSKNTRPAHNVSIKQLGDTGAQVETKRDTVRIKIAAFSAIPVDQSLILSR